MKKAESGFEPAVAVPDMPITPMWKVFAIVSCWKTEVSIADSEPSLLVIRMRIGPQSVLPCLLTLWLTIESDRFQLDSEEALKIV